jgi:hypothetical protein
MRKRFYPDWQKQPPGTGFPNLRQATTVGAAPQRNLHHGIRDRLTYVLAVDLGGDSRASIPCDPSDATRGQDSTGPALRLGASGRRWRPPILDHIVQTHTRGTRIRAPSIRPTDGPLRRSFLRTFHWPTTQKPGPRGSYHLLTDSAATVQQPERIR